MHAQCQIFKPNTDLITYNQVMKDDKRLSHLKEKFYSLNDHEEESVKPKAKGKQRMSKFYLGGKQAEPADDIEDNTLVGTSTASANAPLRAIGSEDSILQLKAHAEEVVSHHAQRLSETALSNSNGGSSASTSNDDVRSIQPTESEYTDDENDVGLPLPASMRPKTSILGNLLDLYAHKLVAPARSSSSTYAAAPPTPPTAPEPIRIPLAPLNRQNNQSGDTLRSTPTSPTNTAIPAARSRSNSLPTDDDVIKPPTQSSLYQKRRKSQPLRLSLNAFGGARGPLTPVDEDAPTKKSGNRSRSSSIDSNTSFTSVNHLLKSFPNHSNFHRVTDFDEVDDQGGSPDDHHDSFPFKRLITPRSSIDSSNRDNFRDSFRDRDRDTATNPLLNTQTRDDCECDLPKDFNNVSHRLQKAYLAHPK